MSAVVNNTRKLKKITPESKLVPFHWGKRKTQIAKSIPVEASTRGYCHEMGFEQCRQRPLKNIKLNKGTFSNQDNECPQEVQWDDGYITLSPFFQRRRHTFKKLPIQTPTKEAKKRMGMVVGGMCLTSFHYGKGGLSNKGKTAPSYLKRSLKTVERVGHLLRILQGTVDKRQTIRAVIRPTGNRRIRHGRSRKI